MRHIQRHPLRSYAAFSAFRWGCVLNKLLMSCWKLCCKLQKATWGNIRCVICFFSPQIPSECSKKARQNVQSHPRTEMTSSPTIIKTAAMKAVNRFHRCSTSWLWSSNSVCLDMLTTMQFAHNRPFCCCFAYNLSMSSQSQIQPVEMTALQCAKGFKRDTDWGVQTGLMIRVCGNDVDDNSKGWWWG